MKLALREYGSPGETPVVLVPGLLGQGRNLAAIARHLSKTRHVFTVDMRNHGKSGWDEAHDYFVMADDILESFDDYPAIDLLGHSMGGKAAMMAALQSPERVRKLIVVDIAPISYTHDYSEMMSAMMNLPLEQLSTRQEIEAALASEVGDAAMRSFLVQGLDMSTVPPRWQHNLTVLKRALPEILSWPEIAASYEGPALFIAGANSDYIPASARSEIARYFPNSKIMKIKNAGHWVHADQPAILAQIVDSFFGS